MLLYLSLFSIAISIVLAIYNWRINKNALLISGIFIIFSTYTITHYFTVYSNNDYWLAIFYGNFSPLWYLPGPLLYFYVKSTLTDRRAIKSGKDYLHFIPLIIHLISISPYLVKPFSEKLSRAKAIHANLNEVVANQINLLYSSQIAFISRPALIVAYSFACFYLLIKYNKKWNELKTKTEIQKHISFKWLVILVTSLLLVSIGFLFLTTQLIGADITRIALESKFAHLFSGSIIFLLPTCLILFFPKVLYGMPSVTSLPKSKKQKREEGKTTHKLENDPFIEVTDSIISYLNEDKPFLNPDFEISDLSIAMQIPQHHIAYCFSSILETKFTAYRTKLRIEHAKSLLEGGEADSLSIDGIGSKSGFPSRSNFYASFKAETGMTPSQYLETL